MNYRMFFRRMLTGTIWTMLLATMLVIAGCGSVAGNASVAALGITGAVPLLTRSSIEVTVEVFQDTELTPITEADKTAFQLPNGTALVQAALANSDPMNYPTLENMTRAERGAAARIGGIDYRLKLLTARIATVAPLDPKEVGPDVVRTGDVLLGGQNHMVKLLEAAKGAFDDFQKAVTDATHDKEDPSDDETTEMTRKLGALQLAFDEVTRASASLKIAWTDYTNAIDAQLKSAADAESQAQALAATAQAAKEVAKSAAAAATAQGSPAQKQVLAQAATHAAQAAQTAETQAQAATRAATQAPAQRQVLTSLKNNPENPIASPNLNNFVFDGLLSDTNFGPLINEAMQDVMSRSRAIDLMVESANKGEKSHWMPFQTASMQSGPGDENAVIYLENMGTPILKTGSFDPSQFIAAFGNLYRVALSSLASTVTTPLAAKPAAKSTTNSSSTSSKTKASNKSSGTAAGKGAATTGTDGTSTGTVAAAPATDSKTGTEASDASKTGGTVLSADTDISNANDSANKSKTALLAAFKAVLDAQAALEQKGPSAKGADVTAAAKALTQAAATLGKPE